VTELLADGTRLNVAEKDANPHLRLAKPTPGRHCQVVQCPSMIRLSSPGMWLCGEPGQAAADRSTTSLQVVNRVSISCRYCSAVRQLVDGLVADDDTAFSHHLLHVTQAQPKPA
jgi:hypothetical protein